MMADWTDLLRTAPDPGDIGAAFQQGQVQAVALQQAKLAEQRKAQEFQQAQAYRGQVAGLLRTGDLTGAAAQAAAYGDDKAATNFLAIHKQGYEENDAGLARRGEIARAVQSLPYEQRSAALHTLKPSLAAYGHAADDVDSFDPTDENIQAWAGVGYSAHDRAGDANTTFANDTSRQKELFDETKPITIDHDLVSPDGKLLYRAQNPQVVSPGASIYNGDTAEMTGGYVGADGGFNANASGAGDALHAAIQTVESGGNPNAVSPKGARGLMQVMGATGRDPGFGVLPARDSSPAELARVGRDYADAMVKRYPSSLDMATAAYNGGPGRVDRALARARVSGGDWKQYLPKETQQYIPKVRAALGGQIQRQPGGVVYTAPQTAAQMGQGGIGGQMNSAPTFNLDPKLTGQDVLRALPAPISLQVKALVDGRQVLAPRFASTPAGQAVIAAANQYDPSFDMVNYNARAATRKDFTSGKSAQSVTAFDTLAQHVDALAQHYDKLGNGNYPIVNTIRNGIRNANGDGRTTALNQDVQAVASEAVRAFRGVGGAEADIQAFKSNFSAAQSPAQAMAAVQSLMHLVRGRTLALQDQYRRGMGTTADGVPGLSQNATRAFDKYDPQPRAQPTGARGSHDDAVAKLRANPQLAQAFDARYGAGASARALGR